MISFKHERKSFFNRVLSAFIGFSFFATSILPPSVSAQLIPTTLNLPAPGTMVTTTSAYTPAIMHGMILNPDNPLHFDFLIDEGDDGLTGDAFRQEADKLIKYFLASLTVPEGEMWVNLSPYEKDRIITDNFGRTEMGRDLLSQDYMLKQLTASLMYPEDDLGNKFWKDVHTKARAQFGDYEIPTDVFHKVWIVPQSATVYQNGVNVVVLDSHLKVMLEQDYLAMEMNQGTTAHGVGDAQTTPVTGVAEQVVREVLLPAIEKEVNEGSTFANLRQIYNSMILAVWYKSNLQESLLGQVYVNQAKTAGIENTDQSINQKIYDQYLKAFEVGVYDYIKEEYDAKKQKLIPRKYFAGGAKEIDAAQIATTGRIDSEAALTVLERAAGTNVVEVDIAGFDAATLTEAEYGSFSDFEAAVQSGEVVRGQRVSYTTLQPGRPITIVFDRIDDEGRIFERGNAAAVISRSSLAMEIKVDDETYLNFDVFQEAVRSNTVKAGSQLTFQRLVPQEITIVFDRVDDRGNIYERGNAAAVVNGRLLGGKFVVKSDAASLSDTRITQMRDLITALENDRNQLMSDTENDEQIARLQNRINELRQSLLEVTLESLRSRLSQLSTTYESQKQAARELAQTDSPVEDVTAARQRRDDTSDAIDSIRDQIEAVERELEAFQVRGDFASLAFRQNDEGITVQTQYADLYTPKALQVLEAVAPLTEKLADLREKRERRFIDRQTNKKKIDFLPTENPDGTDALIPGTNITVKDARAGNFEGDAVPQDLQRQWIQLTGPAAKSPQDKVGKNEKESIHADLRNVAHALLSGADGMMFDGEDALGQLGTMSLDNIRALKLAYAKDESFIAAVKEVAGEMIARDKMPADWDYMSLINDNFTTRIYRARGLHLDDRHVKFTNSKGEQVSVSATAADIALYVTNVADTLREQGSSIALYLPKLQTAEEAAFMAEIMDRVEDLNGLERGTIKAFVLIEQLEETFQLMEMRAALGKHFVGYNTGRWDYIADVVKQNMWDDGWVPPNFKEMTMEYPFMWNYEGRVVRAVNTPDKNGNAVLWIGGMEPQIPVVKGTISAEKKEEAIESAMQIAEGAKLRELRRGASGTWVAHPGMVRRLRKVYETNLFEATGKTNQIGITENLAGEDVSPSSLKYDQQAADALTELREGQRTIAELRFLVSVALQYGNAYLTGRAAAALKGADLFPNPLALFIMEDMATGEGRTKLTRKWMKANAPVTEVTQEDRDLLGIEEGAEITEDLVRTVIEQEYAKLVDAPDDIVFATSKTRELPIAKMAVEKFLLNDMDLPWLIDVLNVALNEGDLEKATAQVDRFIETYEQSGGITRITEDPIVVTASDAASLVVNEAREEARLMTPQDLERKIAELDDEIARELQLVQDENIDWGSRMEVNLEEARRAGGRKSPTEWKAIRSVYVAELASRQVADAAMVSLPGFSYDEQRALIRQVQEWMASDRFRNVKARNWTAEEIANSRARRIRDGEDFPAVDNLMPRALLDIMRRDQAGKTFTATGGVMNGPSAANLAQAGMPALYLSGWQASHHWGEPDLAKYDYNEVPRTITEVNKYLTKQHEDVSQRFQSIQQGLEDIFTQLFRDLREGKDIDVNLYVAQFIDVVLTKEPTTEIFVDAFRENAEQILQGIFEPAVQAAIDQKDSTSQEKRDVIREAALTALSDQLINYRIPFYADGDTGHQSVKEMVRAFVRAGAGGIHIEDQAHGCKKCGHMAGKVLVSTAEHQRRLLEARKEADLLGSELVIIARTDAEAAKLLQSKEDPRDHYFLKGVTNANVPTLASLIRLVRRELDDAEGTPERQVAALREKFPQLAEGVERIWALRGEVEGRSLIGENFEVKATGQDVGSAQDIWDSREAIEFEEGVLRLDTVVQSLDRDVELTVQELLDRRPARLEQEMAAVQALTALWGQRAGMKTFTQVVEEALGDDITKIQEWRDWVDPLKHTRNLDQMRAKAADIGIDITFSEEAARTFEGHYQIEAKALDSVTGLQYGVLNAAKRSQKFASIADVIWMEQGTPNVSQGRKFVETVRDSEAGKDILFAINLSPSFNWSNPSAWSDQLSQDQIDLINEALALETFDWADPDTWGANQDQRDAVTAMYDAQSRFSQEMGEIGFGFQFVTIFQDHVSTHAMWEKARWLSQEGAGGFVHYTQQPEQMITGRKGKRIGTRFVKHQTAAGVKRVGREDDPWTRGFSTTGAAGKESTENQFGAAKKGDKAALAVDPVGGIDLNPASIQMKKVGDGAGIPLPQVSPETLNTLQNIQGFVPTIINWAPVTNMPLILGMADDTDTDTTDYGYDIDGIEPKAKFDAAEYEEVTYLN